MVSITPRPDGYFIGDFPLAGVGAGITTDGSYVGIPAKESSSGDPSGGLKGAKLARFSDIPPDVMWELAEHCGKTKTKYPNEPDGSPNWMAGYDWDLYVDALERHLAKWKMGEDDDSEFEDSHLIAVIWNAMVLRWMQLHNKGRDFRPARGYVNG